MMIGLIHNETPPLLVSGWVSGCWVSHSDIAENFQNLHPARLTPHRMEVFSGTGTFPRDCASLVILSGLQAEACVCWIYSRLWMADDKGGSPAKVGRPFVQTDN